jgi:hypothetical protein
MPIELTCCCGKRLQVADEFAGRQGRCPVCGGLLEIPGCEATVATSSLEPAQSVITDSALDKLLGPGWLERTVAPSVESAANSCDVETGNLKEGDSAKLTVVGYILTLLTVAIIFGVAIPIVRWRDPSTGQPLPRTIAIISPLLIGAAVNGIASLLLRVIGLRVWISEEKGE